MSNVATIGVRIVADATKLQAGLQKALDALDSFGNKFQRAANKIAAVGAAMQEATAAALTGNVDADPTVTNYPLYISANYAQQPPYTILGV